MDIRAQTSSMKLETLQTPNLWRSRDSSLLTSLSLGRIKVEQSFLRLQLVRTVVQNSSRTDVTTESHAMPPPSPEITC